MIPLEVTHQNMATLEVIDHFRNNTDIPFSKAIYNMLEHFKDMYFKAYQFPTPPIHDPLTVFFVLHPEEFDASPCLIEVDTGATSYGRTNVYFQSPRYPQVEKESTTVVATNLRNQKTKFWD